MPPLARSLSAKLLVLTAAFVMLAEVFIFVPSVARYRVDYLAARMAAAHLAVLALEATPDNMVSDDLAAELLDHVGAYVVGLRKERAGKLGLMVELPAMPAASYDLRDESAMVKIMDALATLFRSDNRIIRVVGYSPQNPAVEVEVVLDEAPMRVEMLDYAQRILALSLVISFVTACLVYLALHLVLVRPMRRITESMVAFREDPEDVSREVAPSARTDEIGIAQRELLNMQEAVRSALQQKTRLAALGIAVSKINHDLRNILSTAALVSDRIADSEDPEVRRVTPTLMAAIDRAVNLCSQTLRFTREEPVQLDRSTFPLRPLAAEVIAALPAEERKVQIDNLVPDEIAAAADRDQLFRVLHNLGKNAVESGAALVSFGATDLGESVAIDIADDGPGLPPRAREQLFRPFTGTARPGGTGLGLAIARDLIRAHGGDVVLVSSDAEGTVFRVSLPHGNGSAPR